MRYKTILVHVAPDAGADARIAVAARLALEADAHLVGAAPTGVSRFLTPTMRATAGSRFGALCDAMRRDAALALRRFARLARAAGVASCETRLVEDEADGGMAIHARYCDLVVIGQPPRGAATPAQPPDLARYLLLTGARPVLVVPPAPVPDAPAGEALVAWDASIAATRAVSAALPLLRAAGAVAIARYGDGRDAGDADGGPCTRLAAYLGRHGIAARPLPQDATDDVGAALLALAARRRCGLLVMGGYGHAHRPATASGSVTAMVLRAAALPVLLAR